MKDTKQPPLEDVLDMLLATYPAPTKEAVVHFSRQFPAYRSELLEFAAAWAVETHAPSARPLSLAQEACVFDRAQSHLEGLLHRRSAAANSLVDIIKAAGRSVAEVASALGMNAALVTKLNKRIIRPDTIPARISRSFAELLQVDEAQIVSCWSSRPAAVAGFLANSKTASPPQEDFDTAVRASNLSPASKAALLAGE